MSHRGLLGILLLIFVTGCGVEVSPPQLPSELPALTLEQWKTLPVEEKYDDGTLQRLRAADEKLRSERAWQTFMKDVVMPERMIDIPLVPRQ